MTLPRSAADVLADHVLFEIEAIDRMYLNLYQSRLQHGAGVAAFFVGHRGHRFASSVPCARELLDRMLILSEAHLRAVLIQYQAHHNTARPSQGIAQRVPAMGAKLPASQRSASVSSESAEDPY
jgi:hypothetical protein